ncbi:MAG: tetratricopeptide repeat protein [Phycisphaerae bacterium]|nr:tetratricopeptide repeat protein [Phycisphaerae bacterium]
MIALQRTSWFKCCVGAMIPACIGAVAVQSVRAQEPPVAATQPAEEAVDDMLAAAREAMANNKPDEAAEHFQRAMQKDPGNVFALAGMGQVKLAQQAPVDAMRFFMQAADKAIDLEYFAMAEQLVEQVLTIDPNNAEALAGQGRVLAETGRNVQAIEAYQRYLKTGDMEKRDRAYLALGRLYAKGRYPRQAVSMLRKAEQLNPQDAEIQGMLAVALQGIGRLDEASGCADRAIQLDPENAEYYRTRASILLSLNKPNDAEQAVREGLNMARSQLRATPGDAELLENISELHKSLQAVLQARLAGEPENANLLLELARSITEAASIQQTATLHEALRVMTDAARYAEKDPAILIELATLQFQVYKRADAAATCKKILALDANHAGARSLLEQIGPITTQPAP